MDLIVHHNQMADYNRWSNRNLLQCCQALDPQVLTKDQGAFFHSILGTLNHIMVGDLLWLRRFALCDALSNTSKQVLKRVESFPEVNSLDQILFTDIDAFTKERESLDELIQEWVKSLDNSTFDTPLTYKNSKGIESTRPLGLLISHFFNHQTHHRGQVGTLLNQQGIDPGVTDMLVRIPEV